MFDKLSQIKKLKEMESALSKEEATIEKDGISVTVNGKMEVKKVKLNSEMSLDKQEETVKDCFNQAMRKIQIEAAQKLFQGQ
jgi:DNA-binding protein YbaB